MKRQSTRGQCHRIVKTPLYFAEDTHYCTPLGVYCSVEDAQHAHPDLGEYLRCIGFTVDLSARNSRVWLTLYASHADNDPFPNEVCGGHRGYRDACRQVEECVEYSLGYAAEPDKVKVEWGRDSARLSDDGFRYVDCYYVRRFRIEPARA